MVNSKNANYLMVKDIKFKMMEPITLLNLNNKNQLTNIKMYYFQSIDDFSYVWVIIKTLLLRNEKYTSEKNSINCPIAFRLFSAYASNFN